jgi:orotidine-5'-phosphate decarboxylase
MKESRSRLIVALDVPERRTALAAVKSLRGHVGYFKLGLELFVSEGPGLVEEIRGAGEKVFLDLKLHDIPNTVAGAVRAACRLGIEMLTLHASGGRAMLEAGRKAAEESATSPLVLAVTVLTSLSLADTRTLGIQETPEDWTRRLATVAQEAGIRGLVASPAELQSLRKKFGEGMQLVSPGIRPAGSATQDQARIATPSQAIHAGADFLVVGRPILQAADPAAAADNIVKEMETVISQRSPQRR